MKSLGPNRKEEAKRRPTVICPRCGSPAQEVTTRYGIRSECCNLHSWDRSPLVDQATHDARKKLAALIHDLRKAIGQKKLTFELSRRCKVPAGELSEIQMMNEVTCKKIIKTAEDILVDIMAGSLVLEK